MDRRDGPHLEAACIGDCSRREHHQLLVDIGHVGVECQHDAG